MNAFMNFLAVFLGSGVGGCLRYALSVLFGGNLAATLAANAIGSFLIGVWTGAALPHTTRLLLTVGFCGGFTTFSTFAKESVLLLSRGQYGLFAAYLALSIVLSLAYAAGGLCLSR